MAIGAEAGSSLFSPAILQLLMQAIGGTQDQNTTTNRTGTQTGTQSGTQTGTNTSATTGTNTSATTGTRTGTTNQTTTGIADTSQLQKVFEQQQAGITPQMLAAIFSEGAKKTPGLISATANAVGARSSNNTPLATALTQLNASLTNQAAELDLRQKNASGDTAARIAELTRGSQTTGTTGETSTTNQTGSNTSNTSGTQTGTTTGTNTQNNTDQSVTNNQTDTQPNYGNVTKLLGLLLGGQALNTGLANVGGIGGALTSGTNAIGQLLQGLIGPGQQGFMGPTVQGNVPQFQGGTMPNTPIGIGGTQQGVDSILAALGGSQGLGNTAITPGAEAGLAANLTGGINAGFTGVPGLESLFKELGLAAGSSEADFWSAIGIDPASLSGIGDVSSASDDFSWWTDEGWDGIDFEG